MGRPVCAVATPAGHSAIGVIRFSGEGSLDLIAKLFKAKFPKQDQLKNFARRSLRGTFIYDNQILDEVILIAFLKGASYTGEESGEIHCHGNPLILHNIMKALFAIGFAAAHGGEFTRRAFQNGCMDLSQAEAVQEIIAARGERELQNALFLMKGGFRDRLFAFRSELLNLLADVTAELDFADEDIEFVSPQSLQNSLQSLLQQIKTLQKNSIQSERLRKGMEAALSGAPNSGKSSLLNYLSGSNRALVSDVPGTTRDYIESSMSIEGLPLNLVDTAGIRQSGSGLDSIEKAGIAFSREKARLADVLLLLLDASLPVEKAVAESPLRLLADDLQNPKQNHWQQKKIYVLVNKMDLATQEWQGFDKAALTKVFFKLYPLDNEQENESFFSFVQEVICISILQKTNLETVQQILHKEAREFAPQKQGLMLAAWQQELLRDLATELDNSLQLINNGLERELIAASLHIALQLLGELSGEIPNEEILGRVFSRFCIGK